MNELEKEEKGHLLDALDLMSLQRAHAFWKESSYSPNQAEYVEMLRGAIDRKNNDEVKL